MSGSSILEKYAGRNGFGNGAGDAVPEQVEIDDLGSFGWLRGIRDRALALELRKANGNIVAVPYHGIDRFELDPSMGITLSLGVQKIQIRGRNLNAEIRPSIRLFEGLARHRVSYVREALRHDGQNETDNTTVVDTIEW